MILLSYLTKRSISTHALLVLLLSNRIFYRPAAGFNWWDAVGDVTETPSIVPSRLPSASPTNTPTANPSQSPSSSPSITPSNEPSVTPTVSPTSVPTTTPSLWPTTTPSVVPTLQPSESPTYQPSDSPTISPSHRPSHEPTTGPTLIPTAIPSLLPSKIPTNTPTFEPSQKPSFNPSTFPTKSHSPSQLDQPSMSPSKDPTMQPTKVRSVTPSDVASTKPTSSPSLLSSLHLTSTPTKYPPIKPTQIIAPSPVQKESIPPTKTERSGIPATSAPALAPASAPATIPVVTSKSPTRAPIASPTIPPSEEPRRDIQFEFYMELPSLKKLLGTSDQKLFEYEAFVLVTDGCFLPDGIIDIDSVIIAEQSLSIRDKILILTLQIHGTTTRMINSVDNRDKDKEYIRKVDACFENKFEIPIGSMTAATGNTNQGIKDESESYSGIFSSLTIAILAGCTVIILAALFSAYIILRGGSKDAELQSGRSISERPGKKTTITVRRRNSGKNKLLTGNSDSWLEISSGESYSMENIPVTDAGNNLEGPLTTEDYDLEFTASDDQNSTSYSKSQSSTINNTQKSLGSRPPRGSSRTGSQYKLPKSYGPSQSSETGSQLSGYKRTRNEKSFDKSDVNKKSSLELQTFVKYEPSAEMTGSDEQSQFNVQRKIKDGQTVQSIIDDIETMLNHSSNDKSSSAALSRVSSSTTDYLKRGRSRDRSSNSTLSKVSTWDTYRNDSSVKKSRTSESIPDDESSI